MKQQQGFSLLEMGIVLVIIGLVLGGILGGRSLVASMQAKDVVAIIEDLRTASTYFKQRYNYLPGDFPVAAGDIANYTPVPGDGNGSIGVVANVDAVTGLAAASSEVAEAPLQLFAAGFIDKISSTGTTQHIQTAFGAVYLASVATANGLVANFSTPTVNPAVRNAIVFFNLPCSIVNEVDTKIDDGNYLTGRAIGTTCTNGTVQWYAVAL